MPASLDNEQHEGDKCTFRPEECTALPLWAQYIDESTSESDTQGNASKLKINEDLFHVNPSLEEPPESTEHKREAEAPADPNANTQDEVVICRLRSSSTFTVPVKSLNLNIPN